MPRIRNNRNICLYCFGDLNSDRVCLSCGKKDDDTPTLPHHLARRTTLKKRYLIDKAIGEGGFGITYLAWDIVTQKRVAVKEYYPSGYVSRDPRSNNIIINSKQNYAPSNRGLKRFIDEAKNLTQIKDLSGIVSTTDFFSENNTAYIVMEYLDGISLKKYLKRKGKLDCTTVLTILKPVVYSLVAVHEVGLIHRDISPDNILITKNNEVKLIDFGASKHSNPEGRSVSIVLKQGFAPEEQYRLHGEQGPWTDVYALGVTIYYCVTGQVPPESIQRMYDDTITPPSDLGAVISKRQEKALLKALAVFAKDRYQSVSDFIADMYDANDSLPAKSVDTLAINPTKTSPSDNGKTTLKATSQSSYYFPPRETTVKREKTADYLRTIIWGENATSSPVEEYASTFEPTTTTVQSDGYIYPQRTVFVERKYSASDLRKKLLDE